jgi:hypothetical protein
MTQKRKPFEPPVFKFTYKCKKCGKLHPLGKTCNNENNKR